MLRFTSCPRSSCSYRELAKIKSTYIDALPRMRATDGRVHSSFNETVTTTGRLSSSDPNLQNIPVRTEFGRHIRECFVPLDRGARCSSRPTTRRSSCGCSAHLSGDEHLVAAFNSGADFHASTASRVFGIPVEEVTPELRSRAKAVNFGIVYGQQAFGLSQSLGVPFGEAKDMIDRYFEAYPGVRAYLDATVEKAARARVRRDDVRPQAPHPRAPCGQREPARVWGAHGDEPSHARVGRRYYQARDDRGVAQVAEEGFAAKLLIQVHDELDFSVPRSEVEALSAMVREVMEGVVELKVPLIADVSSAPTWAEAH